MLSTVAMRILQAFLRHLLFHYFENNGDTYQVVVCLTKDGANDEENQ